MTYLGAIIVIISAFFIGISKAREEKTKVCMLRELCISLDILKNEICTNKTPLGKALSLNSVKSFKCINGFFNEIENELSDLGDKRFSDIWGECINRTLKLLPEKSKEELSALGSTLGRYDCDLQRCSIERCICILQSECTELEKGLRDNEKMYIGLYGGAGFILALVLI